jgi:ferredoxin
MNACQVTATCSRCRATVTMELPKNAPWGDILKILSDRHKSIPKLSWDGCQTEVSRGYWSMEFRDAEGPEMAVYVLAEKEQG